MVSGGGGGGGTAAAAAAEVKQTLRDTFVLATMLQPPTFD